MGMADVNGQFGRVRPGQHLHQRLLVEKLSPREPAAPRDHLRLHQRHVRRGATEGGETEAYEESRDGRDVVPVSAVDRGR